MCFVMNGELPHCKFHGDFMNLVTVSVGFHLVIFRRVVKVVLKTDVV
jgi:hypothetical protein